MNLKKGCLLLWLAVVGCVPVPIGFLQPPKFDPALTWQQIQTDHFIVYFHQGEDEAAQEAAHIAEEVHTLLISRIGWTSQGRTHIIISDNEDAANGSAHPFPHNTINVYLAPTPSSPDVPPARLSNWLRRIITHEYVHILQLDMNAGLPAVWRTLFGRYPFPFLPFNGPFPNELQPLWLIEGLAAAEETQVGGTDRAAGGYAEMLLRMAILEDHFPSLDQAAGRLNSWPGPHVHYLFGARFLEYIRQMFGDQALRDLNRNFSGRLFPWGVDMNAYKTLGTSYLTLWEQWKASLVQRYRAEREKRAATGLTPTSPLTAHGDENLNPRMGKSGDIVYTRSDPYSYPALRVLKPSGEDIFLSRRNSGGAVSFSPDQSRLAFAQQEYQRNYSRYSDLYLLDLKSAEVTRLTEGARLRDPDFHPDGNRLIAVQGGGGKDRLVLYDLQKNQVETVPGINPDLLISQPRWSPRGDKIAVSGWDKGHQDIYILDLLSGLMKPIWRDVALDISPAWSPDGRYILFSSDRTGIFNLFAYDIETGTLFQITNLLGGAFTPEIGPDNRILFSYYHSRGFDLHTLNWDPVTWKKVDPERIEAPPPTPSDVAMPVIVATPLESPVQEGSGLDMEKPEASEETKGQPLLPAKPYSPWPTLRPRYWVPTEWQQDPISGTTLGLATGGSDVLGKHQFALDLSLKDDALVSYALDYVNNAFDPALYISTWGRDHTYGSGVPYSNQGFEAGARFDRILFQRLMSLALGYRGERLGYIGRSAYEGGLAISWIWDSAQRYPFSISPEEGSVWGINYWRYGYDFGRSGLTQNQYRFFVNRYDTLFKPNHVLAVELEGGAIDKGSFSVGGDDSFLLRGYPADVTSGNLAAVGTLSYRFPIRNIERGIRTWPFFFSRLHGNLFINAGSAWGHTTPLSNVEFKKGVGAELKLKFIFSYWIPMQIIVGVAQGLDPLGVQQTYSGLGAGF